MMLLSSQTRLGLRVTCKINRQTVIAKLLTLFLFLIGKSFVALVKYLFTISDVKSFLSQRICQDPLENFFGQQRQRGGMHDNPNVKEFIANTQALRVVNMTKFTPVKRGNCRGNKEDEEISVKENSEPLPKRPRKHSMPLGSY